MDDVVGMDGVAALSLKVIIGKGSSYSFWR